MNETVIVVTGAEPLEPSAVADLPRERIVLAADGGLDHALAAGLRPAGLVGDLDSVTPDGLAWAEGHATIERHDPNKDQTDTELALAMAASLDPARLILLAGGGDRLDHTVAAIGALGAASLTHIPEIEGWWGDQHLVVLHGPGRAELDLPTGTEFSLLALHGPCTGVVVHGAAWPLDGIDLEPVVGRGVSNVATDRPITIAVSSGVLTVFDDRTATGDTAGAPGVADTTPDEEQP
ncbi:MAG: thiamine diphosphokinase [Ilumatobacter sp.]|uniref:thiamine diphosphokinase n=1 Tax=Ilumatobacter sp. TaxID=1967498 RepID=UPI002626C7A3|nr:thiamine diphosphokinase [Ilumatobacter sp.]MDJ0767656.1 thiamine diphosphokinase [Ilumatobacter sp.]